MKSNNNFYSEKISKSCSEVRLFEQEGLLSKGEDLATMA